MIAALAERFGLDSFHNPFYQFMDAVDEYIPSGQQAVGLISDFALIPEAQRQTFVEKYSAMVKDLFYVPIGRILAFYPESPAGWLISDRHWERNGPLDPEAELGRLRNLVTKLLPGKDEFAARVRMVPMGRVAKHGRLVLNRGLEVAETIPQYPNGCTDEEKFLVESTARSLTWTIYNDAPQYQGKNWSRYFWNHNFDLTVCRPHVFAIQGSTAITEEDTPKLIEVLETNVSSCQSYIEKLQNQVKCNLYDPSRDEVFFGLLSRVVRLYSLIAHDLYLWSRDLGGIMLRCMAGTAITFGYLAKCADENMFHRFQEYGEGQEKLLMLHLQDNHPEATSLEGRDAASIAEELGGFSVELIDIELGHWAKKDERKLAIAAGMEDIYRLVFSPASGDVHGSWVSLKKSNLCVCVEPLHRFHRLPSYMVPPAYLNTVIAAQVILNQCLQIGIDVLGYPALDCEILDIPQIAKEGQQDDCTEND